MQIVVLFSRKQMMKKYLFMMRRKPHCGSHVQEALDVILTTAAFDQSVSVLFADDGVLQLKRLQNPQSLRLTDTAAIFGALEVYDVKLLYVERESLIERGLVPADLILTVEVIQRKEVNRLIQQHDVVVPD